MPEDLHQWFERVLQGVPDGVWSHIQDEEVMNQCVGVPTEWLALIRRAVVAGVAMNGWLPPGAGGSLAGGAPPVGRGPRGGIFRGNLSSELGCMGLGA
jgi:hypothetical protein